MRRAAAWRHFISKNSLAESVFVLHYIFSACRQVYFHDLLNDDAIVGHGIGQCVVTVGYFSDIGFFLVKIYHPITVIVDSRQAEGVERKAPAMAGGILFIIPVLHVITRECALFLSL